MDNDVDEEIDQNEQQQNEQRRGNPLGNVAQDLQGVSDKASKTASKMSSKAGQIREKAVGSKYAQKLEKRAEKLEKKAKKLEKVAQKAEKFSKLALKIGKIIGLIGFWLLIIMLIIGLLVFILTGWGMLLSGFKQIAQGFFDTCNAILIGGENNVHDDEIVTTLKNIEQMGYDLYGYGFVSAKDESTKDDSGNYKYYDEDEEGNRTLIEALEDKNAYRNITTYLISDNYAYYIKNHNLNFRSMQTNAKHFFGGIFDGTNWGSGLISLYKQEGDSTHVTGIAGEPYGSIGDKMMHGAMTGNIVAPVIGTATGAIFEGFKSIFTDWDEITSSIKVNRANKTLDVSAIGVFSNQIFSYKLDGWTGRYSIPLEFLLATHVATMAPDLSYKLATSFNTDVELLLYKAEDNSIMGGIRLQDGKVITYEDLQDICSQIFNDQGLDIPLLDQWALSKKDAAEIFRTIEGLESQTEGEYHCTGTDNRDPLFSEEKSYQYEDPSSEILNVIKTLFEDFSSANGEIVLEKDSQTITGSNITTFISNDVFDYDSYKSITDTKECTDSEEGKYLYEHKTNDVIDIRWWEYRGVIEVQDKNEENISYEIQYQIHKEKRNGSDLSKVVLNVNKITVLDSPAEELCSARARSDAGLNKTCTHCRDYLRAIYAAIGSMTEDNFDTFVPYINCVTDHWYRNVYFTNAALKKYENDGEYVITDFGYEEKTGERWTLYERDRGVNNNDELYVCLPDSEGEYSGEFARVADKYIVCRDVGEENGQYSFAKEGETTYKQDDKGKYKLFLIVDESSNDPEVRYSEYSNTSIEQFKVARKAKTEKKEDGWNAYDGSSKIIDGGWKELEITDDTPNNLKKVVELGLTPVYSAKQGAVLQNDDGVRGQTNAKIKQMFLDDYYIYDGSGARAALIEEAKNMVRASGAAAEDIDNPDTFRTLFGEDKTIKAEYDGQETTAKIGDISGSINLSQNSLTAFEILTNMHTLDSEYIYHDFKELAVELNYFDKEDLTESEEKVMMFPIADISSAGWPVTRYDKNEEFYGTLIHSAEDYEALRAETQEELSKIAPPEEKEDESTIKEPKVSNITITESGTMDWGSVAGLTDAQKCILQAAEDIQYTGVKEDWHYYTKGYPLKNSFEDSNKGVCCATLVWYVSEACGVEFEGTHSAAGVADNLLKVEGTKEIISSSYNDLEPGDFVVRSTEHIQIYAGKDEAGNYMWYNWGSDDRITTDNQPYASTGVTFTRIVRITDLNLSYDGMKCSTANTQTEFEGYEGGEAVLAPVTGEVVKYGTLERTNMELINNGVSEEEAKEEVGFIKIRVLGNTECLPGNKNGCTYFSTTNDEKKGYNYFWEEYSDAGITNHVLYIEGFDVSKILGDSPSPDNSVEGGNIKALSDYIASEEGQENCNYTTDYKVPKLQDKDEMQKLQDKEDAKENALYTIEKGGKIYIKEGAVIGYTYTQEDAKTVEKEIKVAKEETEDEEEPEAETATNPTEPSEDETTEDDGMLTKTCNVGRYMRIIFRDEDDQVVENVENYIEIDEVGSKKQQFDNFSIIGTVLSEDEWVSCALEYARNSSSADSIFKNEADMREFYKICVDKGINPEWAFVRAILEQGLHANNGNYWGLGVWNGSGQVTHGDWKTTLAKVCDTLVTYQDPTSSEYQMIMNRYQERKNCSDNGGCSELGYGTPDTNSGIMSIYASLGKHITGSSGAGGYYYMDPAVAGVTDIYKTHEEFLSKCKNVGGVHAYGTNVTVWEESQYTAYQSKKMSETGKQVFGEKAGTYAGS